MCCGGCPWWLAGSCPRSRRMQRDISLILKCLRSLPTNSVPRHDNKPRELEALLISRFGTPERTPTPNPSHTTAPAPSQAPRNPPAPAPQEQAAQGPDLQEASSLPAGASGAQAPDAAATDTAQAAAAAAQEQAGAAPVPDQAGGGPAAEQAAAAPEQAGEAPGPEGAEALGASGNVGEGAEAGAGEGAPVEPPSDPGAPGSRSVGQREEGGGQGVPAAPPSSGDPEGTGPEPASLPVDASAVAEHNPLAPSTGEAATPLTAATDGAQGGPEASGSEVAQGQSVEGAGAAQ